MIVDASRIAMAARGTVAGSRFDRDAKDSVTAVDDTSPPTRAVTAMPRPGPSARRAT